MNNVEFEKVFEEQVERSRAMLIQKAEEYASDIDRLANFKRSAALQKTSPMRALMGKMAKHTISLYDMLTSDDSHDMAVWDEKITDHINYLILLRALLEETPNKARLDVYQEEKARQVKLAHEALEVLKKDLQRTNAIH